VASCIVRPTTPAVEKYGYMKVQQQAGKRKDGEEKKLEIRFILGGQRSPSVSMEGMTNGTASEVASKVVYHPLRRYV
jgi:hypothetical protein